MAGGVTLFQFLPSSRVTWIKPSSVPTQTVVRLKRRRADGVDHAEAVGHRLIDILGGDRVERCGHGGIHRARSGLIFSQVLPRSRERMTN